MSFKAGCKVLIFLLVFLTPFTKLFSQVSITGPSCVVAGAESQFTISGNWNSSTYMEWCITGGVLSGTTNICQSGTPYPNIRVVFTNNGTTNATGEVRLYSSSGSSTKTVTIAPVLQPGAISSNKSQTVTSGATPATIGCSVSIGGYCTPSFSYQWQRSADNVNWTNVTGATSQNLSFSTSLTQTTYYRRAVTENNSFTTKYSDVATVTVTQPVLNGGTFSTSSITIPYNTFPTVFKPTAATGGTCAGNYQYQWQFSLDNLNFADVALENADSLRLDEELTETTFFRRRVVCGTDTAYTNKLTVNVSLPFNPGTITSGNQTIAANTTPAQITATAAANCNGGTLAYQWQVSQNGYTYSNIIGATTQNLVYNVSLTQSSFFRRRAVCGAQTKYTNVVLVQVVQPVSNTSDPEETNSIDSLLNSAGLDLLTAFNIASDSIANNRRPTNSAYAQRDTATQLELDLSKITNSFFALDSADQVIIDTVTVRDDIQTRLDKSSEAGGGTDSTSSFIPFLDDNAIQLYRSTGNYNVLDSIIGIGSVIPIEEMLSNYYQNDTTVSVSALVSENNSALLTTKGAVVNGPSIVSKGQIVRYTSSFQFPLGNSPQIKWVVRGGTIVSQNANPSAGQVYADVQWQSSYGTPYIGLFDRPSLQSGNLPIFIFAPTGIIVPFLQAVYYNQIPAVLHVSTSPAASGTYYKYQWQSLDVYSTNTWANISGATTATYQPPALTAAWRMYRRITYVHSSADNSLLSTSTSSAASVRLIPLNAGALSATVTDIPQNSSPAISQTAAKGAFIGASGVTASYTWEASVNGSAWQTIGTGLNFPAYQVTQSHTRIRRVVQLTGVNTSLPQSYWKAYSNEINFTTYYQTGDFENRNYIRESIILTRGISTWENADQQSIEKKIQTTTYLDGLSRPIQTVGKGTHYSETTNQWYDMVQSITYEAGGRVDKSLLPYPSTENIGKFKNNVATDQPAFYNAKFGEGNAFAKVDYDNSPQNRVLKAYAPGNSWAGNNIGVSGNFEPYPASENVRYWTIGYNSSDLPVSTQSYPDLFLLKQVGADEKGKKVITYSDKTGQVILKKVQLGQENMAVNDGGISEQHAGWLCTYYVYDDFGQLRFTITPKAVVELENTGWAFTQTIADELCFRYEYDELGRTVAKKVPGKAAEHYVYDQRNRVVFTQDGNQRAQTTKEWNVRFYDELNRVVLTALYKSVKTRDQLQADMNSISGSTTVTVPAQAGISSANLIVSQRNTNLPQYAAEQSIEFIDGFESASNDAFIAEVGPNTGGAVPAQIMTVSVNPVPQIDINDPSKFTPLTYSYYDNYTYSGAKTFNAHIQLAYKDGDVEAYTTTKRIAGLLTGKKVRMLNGGSQFLTTTVFYDEEGRAIQQQEDNLNGGVELTASQYHFDGRVLSSLEVHDNPATPYSGFPILTKYKFDKVGRVKAIAKKINNTARSYTGSTSVSGATEDDDAGYKTIASYQYNELGRRVKKILSPQFNNGAGLETIDYEYNIRGWLTGINKAYALGEYTSNQWEHFFGMYIGYDNRDGKFAAAQYNGQITGIQWKSQGDNTPRKYDYTYDNANRLLGATFTQKNEGTTYWSRDKMDFSVYNIRYDVNGNLLFMYHKGVLPGGAAPVDMDRMTYTYRPQSNLLARVDEQAPTANEGKLGDFKDGTNGTATPDYDYDANGNLTIDRNKNIEGATAGTAGITYNHLDLPVKINLPGKGFIQYVYSATGAKLQKIVTDNTPLATGGQAKIITTTYIGAFVYEKVEQGTSNTGTNLQFMAHEEGRIRIITPYVNASDPANLVSGGLNFPAGKQGVFDYFIKDHLGNTRAIITEEINKASSVCTMEDANTTIKQNEEGLFGNPGSSNEVAGTSVAKADYCPAWTSNTSLKVSRLQGVGGATKVGPNVLLRVMAGDKVSAKTDYYYAVNPGPNSTSTGLEGMLQSLVSALTGGKATTLMKDQSGAINSALSGTVPLQSLYNSQPTSGNTAAPKAYLNYIFFDEQMNYVGQGSGFLRVSQAGNGASPLIMTEARAPKNGYVYVYLSNESAEPVYFDNFTVSHQRSPLIQEDHYYAYGLRIQAISSKAVSTTLNQKMVSYGYQGSFSEEVADFELNYNEFLLRTYDPQVGRWTGADPFDEFASPYLGMGSDPVSNVDPTGGFIGGGSFAGAIFGSTSKALLQTLCPGTATVVGVLGTQIASTIAIGGAFTSHMQTIHIYNHLSVTIGNSAGSVGGSGAGGINGSMGVEYGNAISELNDALNGEMALEVDRNPTPLPQWVGSRYYYRKRYADFSRRHANDGKKAPDYYLSYGDKYIQRFSDVTRDKLSDEGQKWLDRALRYLQEAIEKELKRNPAIETNNTEFRIFAFRSHVPAYEKAGVLRLGILDKVKILLTPDAADLLSPEGLEQAKRVGADQIDFYKSNPDLLLKHSLEFINNTGEIMSLVVDYAVKNALDPSQVYKLIKTYLGF